MRRVLKSIFALAVFTIISVSFALFLKDQYPEVLGAGPVLKVNQGGTGATSFTSGECLKGNGTGAVTTGSCGSGTGTETDPIWIASSTNYYTKALSDGRYDVLGQATSSLTSHTSSFNHANYNTAYGWGNHAGLYDVLGQATSTLNSHNTAYNHATFLTSVASDATWATHNSYPPACSAGQYVTAIGDTLTCSTPAGGSQTPWTQNIDGGGYSLTNVGTATTTNLRVTGNVGIGTVNPTFDLENVQTYAGNYGYATIGTRNLASDGWSEFALGNNISAYAGFMAVNGSTGVRPNSVHIGTGLNAPLYFWTNDAIYMTLDAGGNLGINDETPSYKLDVNGSFRVTASTTIGNLTTLNCDVKADINGGLYCGIDATGAGGITGSTGQFAYFSGTDTAVGTSSISIDASGLISFTQRPFIATSSRELLDTQTYFNDFLVANPGGMSPFLGSAVSSGAVTMSSSVNHNNPGYISLRDSATANGGYAINTAVDAIKIGGGELFMAGFKILNKTSRKVRLGFQDTLTHVDPAEGIWLEYDYNASSTSIIGRTSNNNIRSTTTSGFVFNTINSYKAVIEVVSSSLVKFRIYEAFGSFNLVWEDALTTNIPYVGSGYTGFGVQAYEVTSSGATDLVLLDYIHVTINRRLYR